MITLDLFIKKGITQTYHFSFNSSANEIVQAILIKKLLQKMNV